MFEQVEAVIETFLNTGDLDEALKEAYEPSGGDSDILLKLLRKGPLNWTELPFDTTRMYHSVRHLSSLGHRIERTDAGGNPTWELREAYEPSHHKFGSHLVQPPMHHWASHRHDVE